MNKQETYEYLRTRNIEFEITEHKAVFNMKEFADVELPYPQWDAKNLFVRDDKKRNYYLITVKGDKRVENVSTTQQRLIENLKNIVNPQKKYLLDGHFCLLKKDNSIERVPLKVFQQINPLAVIIVKEKSEVIRERLQKRDGRTYNISQIEMMQKEEIESAKDLCTHLNIQLFESSTENIHETIVFLQNQQFFTGS